MILLDVHIPFSSLIPLSRMMAKSLHPWGGRQRDEPKGWGPVKWKFWPFGERSKGLLSCQVRERKFPFPFCFFQVFKNCIVWSLYDIFNFVYHIYYGIFVICIYLYIVGRNLPLPLKFQTSFLGDNYYRPHLPVEPVEQWTAASSCIRIFLHLY